MRFLTITAFMLIGMMHLAAQDNMAQDNAKSSSSGENKGRVDAKTKYEIFLDDCTNEEESKRTNDSITNVKQKKRGWITNGIGLLWGSTVTKTANATTGILNLLIESMKGQRKEWLQASQQGCVFTKNLASESKKGDFYKFPSTKGAMDPENILFKGFGCRNYLERIDSTNMGREIFRVYCRLRTDSEGVASIVDHSKFLVEIDTIMFDPFHCSLPYDSVTRKTSMAFDFRKRNNLAFQLNVKIYSSWINEAIMVTKDQLLGEFNIRAKIDEKNLNEDSIFVYSSANEAMLKDGTVSIEGDCFLVPRSFTGTLDGKTATRSWGTGEYRVEMTVTETCQIEESFYREAKEEGEEEGENGDWIKERWQDEWKQMKSNRNTSKLGKDIGNTIISTFKGSDGWLEVFTEPVITSINTDLTSTLNGFIGVTTTTTTSASMP